MTPSLPRTARDVTLEFRNNFRAITGGQSNSSPLDRMSPYLPEPLDGPEGDLASLLAAVAGPSGQFVSPRRAASAVTTSLSPPRASRQPSVASSLTPRPISVDIEPLATPRDGDATASGNDAANSSDVLYYSGPSADSGIVPEAAAHDDGAASTQPDSKSQPAPTAAIERVLRMLGGSFDSPPAPPDSPISQLVAGGTQAGIASLAGAHAASTSTAQATSSALSGGQSDSSAHGPSQMSRAAVTRLELTFSNFDDRISKALARVIAKLEGAITDLKEEARATRMRELQRRAAYRGFR
jgi:hypothetical protein